MRETRAGRDNVPEDTVRGKVLFLAKVANAEGRKEEGWRRVGGVEKGYKG